MPEVGDEPGRVILFVRLQLRLVARFGEPRLTMSSAPSGVAVGLGQLALYDPTKAILGQSMPNEAQHRAGAL